MIQRFTFRPRLSPLTRKRLRQFARMRRVRIALILLAILGCVSLSADFLSTSRPLFLRVNDRIFFPVVQTNLTRRDLLGETAEPTLVNYPIFLDSDDFRANPRNLVIRALFPHSPGDVIDASTLAARRTVRVSVVPESHVGRLNLLPDGSIILPVSCEPFFPGADRIVGLRLRDHWQIPDDLAASIESRLTGAAAPAQEFRISSATDPQCQALVALPKIPARDPRPASVRLMFRQTEPIERPFQLRFRRAPDGAVYPVSARAWRRTPAISQPSLQALAEQAFEGSTAHAIIPWHGRPAEAASGLTEIAWPFPPVRGHWMGIDSAGRDVLARVLHGMRTALLFGMALALWAMVFGLFIGAAQGYFGGWADIAGQRLTEIWSALPFLYVMIFVGSALGRSFLLLLVCYSLFNWIGISYYMRAEFLRLRHRTFVEAARCQGLSTPRIIFNHILPNALTPLVTLFPFSLIGAIGALTALDFLGFGLPPLSPSWGELLQQARTFRWAWWLILFPSLALFLVMLLTVIVGEGLRDAFDPRQRIQYE